jgi:hypothetical protein
MKALLTCLAFALPASVFAQNNNQLLIVSGGGSPSSNHYSQYLQTNSIYENLKNRLDYKVNVFFGAGNNQTTVAEFADVHKIEKKPNMTFEKFIVGTIQNNKAATKENVFNFFKSDISSNLENFFLVVSDHGMPNVVNGSSDPTFSNNCIDMWNVKNDNGILVELGAFEETRCLSKNELKTWMADFVPAKKKIFAMSQCFSGGFHQISVDESKTYPTADTNICGFTAITHDTWASGCSPDVDGPTYQGYERSFTEQLTGYDYVNNKRLRPGRASFLEAHSEAILEDLTVDIPLATSDYYLWRWALKIEDTQFSKRTSGDLAKARGLYTKAADFLYELSDTDFKAKKLLYLKMGKVIQTKFPDIATTVELPIRELAVKIADINKQMKDFEDQLENLGTQSAKIFENVTFKFWLNQIALGSSLNLTTQELAIENYVISLGNTHKTSGSRYLKNRLLPIFWVQNPKQGEAYSVYLSQRLNKVSQYALSSGDAGLVQQTTEMLALDQQEENLSQQFDDLARRHGLLRRMLIYRQTLGAWAALDSLNDIEALRETKGLIRCEETKL